MEEVQSARLVASPPTSGGPLDPELSELRETLRKLERPQRFGVRWIFFVASLVAFWWSMRATSSLSLAVIVVVLLLHELGHYAAMKRFGYRDLKVFFVPFMGAAVSGREQDPNPWHAGIVSLAGPVPGLLIGAALTPLVMHEPRGVAAAAVYALVAINGLNLLPFVPLDGGRLLSTILFSRKPVLELLAMVVGAIGIVWSLDVHPRFYPIAGGLLIGALIRRVELLDKVKKLRTTGLHYDGLASELPDLQLAKLRNATDNPRRRGIFSTKRGRAADLSLVLQALQRRSATMRDSAILFGAWAAAGLIALASWTALRHPAPAWHHVDDAGGHWTADFPGPTHSNERPGKNHGVLKVEAVSATLGAAMFDVTAFDIDWHANSAADEAERGARWVQMSADALAKKSSGPFEHEAIEVAGHQGLKCTFTDASGNVEQTLLLVDGRRGFLVAVAGEKDRATRERFLSSFSLASPSGESP